MSWPPNGSSSGSSSHPPQDLSRISPKPFKLCGVCGDRAKSYHFGGISCDSCKAFFRRSVQNEAYRNFHCPYDRKCDITINSRKCCQYCRFQKCLSIGMEKGWVMSEEERMQLLRSRLEKRQRQEATVTGKRSRNNYEPDVLDLPKYLAEEDIRTIEQLVNYYEISYKVFAIPPASRLSKGERSRTEILDMFFTSIKQFSHFSQRLDAFSKISRTDQEILLRSGVIELCFIRGAHIYDERNLCWPDRGRPLYRDAPVLFSDDIRKLVSTALHEKHMKFITGLKELDLDEPTVMLLLVIVLLSPDRQGLKDADVVAKEQERYYLLMRNYMRWRYGLETSSVLYPKLLLKLPDLRELADAHTEYHLRLEKKEMEELQERLSSLQLDPEPLLEPESQLIEARWTIRSYVATLVPSSPLSLEDESCSSDGSERYASQRKDV